MAQTWKQLICEQQQQELAQRERKSRPRPKPWNGGCQTRVLRGGRANVNGKPVLLCNNPFHVQQNGRNYCRIHCHGGLYEDITHDSDYSDDDSEEDDDRDFIASESEEDNDEDDDDEEEDEEEDDEDDEDEDEDDL